ncbi:MAG: ATP-binding cassette domain-containing protein [Chlamydiia bacterium]|nr:ATP-binding cassette domain-containing protein [Chlamydiia bacterium]
MYILKCSNISYSINNFKILDDINIKVLPNTINAIIGINGSGKTSFMNILAGHTKATYGEVFSEKKVFHMPQHNEIDINFPISVIDFVLLGLLTNKKFSFTDKDVFNARSCMQTLGLGNIANKRINALSGGQLKRVLLARGIVSGASLFLLDEPLCGIDNASVISTLAYLKQCVIDSGITIIMITHHHQHINNCWADKIYKMEDGKLINIDEEAICSKTTTPSKVKIEIASLVLS